MMPFIEVLLELRAEVAAAVDGATVRGRQIKVRHHRHRESATEEFPCIALRRGSNDPSQRVGREETSTGMPEEVMEFTVDLVIDDDLPPEEEDPASVLQDPTGYGGHADILRLVLERLFPDQEAGFEPNTLNGAVWDMTYDGSAPDEGDATPDSARMEERLTLLYRVRADRPTVLLRS